ncbi:hypothetical protein IV203_029402 [Nitzschia inconspicua]|uniref:Uncharacterized protein n=1 Tax=Nitzschia inconspicua TaxID=303405 RepID=A0A9K3Q0D8_9STRA|nr:hypothetical protein IV203_029402 [Nitzschia inconspicua]
MSLPWPRKPPTMTIMLTVLVAIVVLVVPADAVLFPTAIAKTSPAFVNKFYRRPLSTRGGAAMDENDSSTGGSSKSVDISDEEEEEEEDDEEATDVDMESPEDDASDNEWEKIEVERAEIEEDENLLDQEEEIEMEVTTEIPEEGETVVEERIETVDEEYNEEGLEYQNDILIQSRVEEDDVRLVAGTTDGELADDEGMDSISTPEDAAELAAVTAGGAVLMAEEEIDVAQDDDNDTVLKEVVAAELEDDIEVTDEMKQVLRNELKYTARDVKLMRPEIASMVVYNKLMRPVEGMPRNWYVEGAGPIGPLRENALKIALAIAVAGAGAAFSLNGGGMEISELLDPLKKVPASIAAFSKSFMKQAKTKVEESSVVVEEALEPEQETTFSGEEMKEMENEVPHSIKPGSKPFLTGNEDKSALDKFLSKIENMIKGFFRIEI